MNNTKLPKIAVISWLDSTTHPGWHKEGTEIQPKLVMSAGWLLSEDDKMIRISNSWVLNGDFADSTVILKDSLCRPVEYLTADKLQKWLKEDK